MGEKRKWTEADGVIRYEDESVLEPYKAVCIHNAAIDEIATLTEENGRLKALEQRTRVNPPNGSIDFVAMVADRDAEIKRLRWKMVPNRWAVSWRGSYSLFLSRGQAEAHAKNLSESGTVATVEHVCMILPADGGK